MALGTMSVCWLINHFAQDWNISWSPHGMNPTDRLGLIWLTSCCIILALMSIWWGCIFAFWCNISSLSSLGLFLTCGVVLQHRVLAKGLEPPGDQNILEVCRGGIVTPEDHRGKQCCVALLLRNNHLNTHRHCGGTTDRRLNAVLYLCVCVCVSRNKGRICPKRCFQFR